MTLSHECKPPILWANSIRSCSWKMPSSCASALVLSLSPPSLTEVNRIRKKVLLVLKLLMLFENFHNHGTILEHLLKRTWETFWRVNINLKGHSKLKMTPIAFPLFCSMLKPIIRLTEKSLFKISDMIRGWGLG